MFDAKTLQARKAMVLQKAQLMVDAAAREGRTWTADDEDRHKALMAEAEALDQRIERAETDAGMAAQILSLIHI